MNKTRLSILSNIISNTLLQLITVVSALVLPPLIVNKYGSTVNGLISSISQFVAYLSLVEAGIGAASTSALYKPLAVCDCNSRDAILSATRIFYNKSGTWFSLLLLVLAAGFPFVVSGQVEKSDAFLMVIVIGMTTSFDFFYLGKYRVLLTADQKLYVLSLAQVFGIFVNLIVSIILIRMDYDIVIVKLIASLLYLSRYLIVFVYIRKTYPDICLHVVPDNESISQRWDALVHQLAGLIVFNSPIIIITIFCGLKEVSVYSIYALIFSALTQILGAFSNGIQSFFGESLVKNDIEYTRSVYKKFKVTYYAIAGIFFSCAILLIKPFLIIYTQNMKDAVYVRPKLAFLILVLGLINTLRVPDAIMIIAAGHFKATRNRSICEAGLNLLVSLVLVKFVGIYSVVIGGICSSLYRLFDVTIYTNRTILHTRIWDGFTDVLKFCLTMVIVIIPIMVVFHIEINTYFVWVLFGFLFFFVFSLWFGLLAFVKIKCVSWRLSCVI